MSEGVDGFGNMADGFGNKAGKGVPCSVLVPPPTPS